MARDPIESIHRASQATLIAALVMLAGAFVAFAAKLTEVCPTASLDALNAGGDAAVARAGAAVRSRSVSSPAGRLRAPRYPRT